MNLIRQISEALSEPNEAELVHQLEADLRALKDAVGPNVDLLISIHPGSIYLRSIKVLKSAPQGTGTEALEKLIAIANRYEMPLCLSIAQRSPADRKDPYKQTTSRSRLITWYRSLGFKRRSTLGRYDLSGEYVKIPN